MNYDHPGFRDVYMHVLRKFYIKEKDMWSLKIQWVHRRRGVYLSDPYRIKMTNQKWKEFRRVL